MNNISIYASALQHNRTIKNRKAATINGGQIGVDNYAVWKSALDNAHSALYTYNKTCVDTAIGNAQSAEKSAAFNALKPIFDLIGEVNGFKLTVSDETLAILSPTAVTLKTPLVGEAELVDSQRKNLVKQLEAVHNGMSEDYVNGLKQQLTAAESRLDILKKQSGSTEPIKTKSTSATYYANIERELAILINKQSMKSWAELKAEEDERKAKRAEARKAAKAAKKAAEAAVRKVGAEVTERAVQIATERVESETTTA